jgi:hypothetical protein
MALNGTGILPFGIIGPRSDHAILYLDFSLSTLSGITPESPHDPTHPSNRNLWSTDVKAATKYTKLVRTGFEAENIATRITILLNRCDRTGRCTTDDERILNHINRDITRIMLRAETDCKKPHGHAWSPLVLANAGRTVIAAKWHLSDVLNGRLTLPLWKRAQAIIDTKTQVKEAYQLLRTIQKHAKEIRDSFLEDRAEHLAET